MGLKFFVFHMAPRILGSLFLKASPNCRPEFQRWSYK